MRFLSFFEWLGSPAVIAQLRSQVQALEAERATLVSPLVVQRLENENEWLRQQLERMEEERKKLQDSALEKAGARMLDPEPLPPAIEQSTDVFAERIRQDILSEVAQLQALAAQDVETYGPMLQEAVLRYHEYLQ